MKIDISCKNKYVLSFFFFSTTQILANEVTEINDRVGRKYFEGSLKFQATLTTILNMLTNRVKRMAEDDIYGANVSQMWGIGLLIFVMMLSPVLIILAKNAITSIQLFAGEILLNTHLYYIINIRINTQLIFLFYSLMK